MLAAQAAHALGSLLRGCSSRLWRRVGVGVGAHHGIRNLISNVDAYPPLMQLQEDVQRAWDLAAPRQAGPYCYGA